jgi:hypothetical protein
MKSQSNFIVEVIPIVLILLFTLYTKSMVEISYTVLGKIVAVGLIVGYSIYDLLYGLVMCAIVILYYQLDSIEGMETIKPMKNTIRTNTESAINSDNSSSPTQDNYVSPVDSSPVSINTMDTTISQDTVDTTVSQDTMDTTVSQEGLSTDYYDFQKKYCRNSQLYYKEYPIKTEMAEHIFPQIKFDSNHCNPCDPNCKFSFVEQKIRKEYDLILPKSSNDSYYDSWKDIFGKENTFFPRLENLSDAFYQFTN